MEKAMQNRKAFTIIELLTVIAIIGILIAVIQPILSSSSAHSRKLMCESNLSQIGMAAHVYAEDYGSLPDSLDRVDSILRNRQLLTCPGTGEKYFYHVPGPDAKNDVIIASCVDPSKPLHPFSHQLGSCYLELTAGGKVQTVFKQ
jgi:prepilin-type N-terminal cleavage/methylation domain-containing protein